MAANVDGLISGLDTTTIISQLMQLERIPQTRLKTQQDQAKSVLAIYQQLNSKFDSLRSAALSLSKAADWKAMNATSSATDAVSVTASSGALTGSLSFTVEQLAKANAIASSGTVSSTAATVASGPLLLTKGTAALGVASVGNAGTLTAGTYNLAVTSGAFEAELTGGSADVEFLANTDLTVNVNGVARNVSITAGTYTTDALAAELQTQLGGDVSVTAENGTLRLATTATGSASALSLDQAAADALGLTAITAQGGEGKVKLGAGDEVVVHGASVTVSGPVGTGSVDLTFGGPLVEGSATLAKVATGDGSLAAVVDSINLAKSGITAAAVKVGPDSYRLQLSSTTTGAAATIGFDAGQLTGFGAFDTVQSGQDAVIHVGDGPGGYDVASATNTVTDVLPGVTLQLKKADENLSVTVDVGHDADALAAKVNTLVEAANAALSLIKTNASYDPATKKAGVLLSDGLGRTLQGQLLRAVSDAVAGNDLATASRAGVTTTREGLLSFDKAKFLAAYAADPDAVEALFAQTGTATDSSVSFVSASTKTQAGTYAVTLTNGPAEAAGGVFVGAGLAAAETIQVRVGGQTVTYNAALGEALADVATGLSNAFTGAGVGLSAVVEGGKLVVRSAASGPAASFEVQTSAVGVGQTNLAATAGAWFTHTGTVAGTIDGQPATYSDGVLTSAATSGPTVGLALKLSTTTPGAYGTVSYVPGIAQRLTNVAGNAVEFGTGSIKNAIAGRESAIKSFDTRMSDWDVRLALRETVLRRQYAALETALGSLRSQSTWLAGQLGSLPSSSS